MQEEGIRQKVAIGFLLRSPELFPISGRPGLFGPFLKQVGTGLHVHPTCDGRERGP